MGLIAKRGRRLVLAGLLITIAGAGALLSGGAVSALTNTLLVVAGISVLCLFAVPFLPKKAAVLEH